MISVTAYRQLPRLLGAQAFVILGLLQAARLEGLGPVSAQWLMDNSPAFGKNMITAGLRKLTSPEYQLAMRVQGGWVFNAAGAFQLPLGYALVDDQQGQIQNPAQRDFGPDQVIDAEPDMDEKEQNIAKNHPQNPAGREIPAQRDLSKSLVKTRLLLKDSKDSLNCLDSQKSREKENRLLLEKAFLAIGKPITWNSDFADRSRDDILSWIAQAYDSRDKLQHPWGVVYKGLQKNRQPDAQYRTDPARFLPQEYLAACGLVKTDESSAIDEPEYELDDDVSDDIQPVGYLPELDARESGYSPNAAWRRMLDMAQLEMPAGVFAAKLAETRPATWNENTGEIVITGPDPEWLNDRLKLIAQRNLSGMMNCPISVRFEQPGAAGDEHDQD